MSEPQHATSDSIDVEHLRRWIGRTHLLRDIVYAGPLDRLAGLLDHESPPWSEGIMPPLGHWLYFLTHERQSLLGADGHPKRGEFLPPVPLPRRMWAAGRVQFQLPVALGATVARRSTIMSVTGKSGRSGPMIFVTLRHEVLLGESVAVLEEQDIVYRGAALLDAGRSPPADNSGRRSDNSRRIIVDSVQLFRFSALTYNAHRIHYDRNYAREVEGYPGLVVHGPYIAMLLMDHFLRQAPARRVLSFNFRAERPLFDNSALDLCLSPTAAGADLWAADTHGATALSATIICD